MIEWFFAMALCIAANMRRAASGQLRRLASVCSTTHNHSARSLTTTNASASGDVDGGDYGVYTGGKIVPYVTDLSFIQPDSLPT